jgi:hypothetical protein
VWPFKKCQELLVTYIGNCGEEKKETCSFDHLNIAPKQSFTNGVIKTIITNLHIQKSATYNRGKPRKLLDEVSSPILRGGDLKLTKPLYLENTRPNSSISPPI